VELDKATYWVRFLMDIHGITEKGWTYEYGKAFKTAGTCYFRRKLLRFSQIYFIDNIEDEVIDTILHEIAHAIAGHKAGHGPIWKSVCRQIGCSPTRHTPPEAIHRKRSPKYTATCPNCHRTVMYASKPRKNTACGRCCKLHNNSRHSMEFVFIVAKIDSNIYIKKS